MTHPTCENCKILLAVEIPMKPLLIKIKKSKNDLGSPNSKLTF